MRDDRSLPVTALHRFNYAVPATPKYNEAAKMGAGPLLRKENLKPIPEGNKGKGLAKLSEEVRNNMGFQSKNKFCGGTSTPYKRYKK